MKKSIRAIAHECLISSENNTITFREIIRILTQNGFESYRIDYLRNSATYYLVDNSSFELPTTTYDISIGKEFNIIALQSAIKEAQNQVDGYSYKEFCKKIMTAGCISYIVSLTGKRALYYGHSAETHVELFPE